MSEWQKEKHGSRHSLKEVPQQSLKEAARELREHVKEKRGEPSNKTEEN